MMTNIAPGIDFPVGWHPLLIVWGPHTSIGVSAMVQEVPVPVASSTWGAVKALFR